MSAPSEGRRLLAEWKAKHDETGHVCELGEDLVWVRSCPMSRLIAAVEEALKQCAPDHDGCYRCDPVFAKLTESK